MWARANVFATECPKSLITPQSLEWLDEFTAWKTLGGPDPRTLNIKTAEAIALLDLELKKELAREKEKQ